MSTSISQPNGTLYPTNCRMDGSRYKATKKSQYAYPPIETGAQCSPAYLPPQWSAHVQPEGKPYFFYHDGPLAAVTESWMYDSKIAAEVEGWIRYLSSEIANKDIALEGLELCLRLDEDEDCHYYIIDKKNRSLFWIEEYSSDQVHLMGTFSPSHLKLVLEAQFWIHTDHFPAHFGGLPETDLLKTLDIFAHTRMDQITSASSAFEYSPAHTQDFYDLLKDCKGRTSEPEIVSIIARARQNILHSRILNLYGEETPRLDNSMSVIADSEEEQEEHKGFSIRIMAFFTFGKSEENRARLNGLYIDTRVIYHHVYAFIEKAVKEWKETSVHAFAMLLLHGAFFFFIASQAVAVISAALLSASLLTSFALVHQLDGLMEHEDAPIAFDWLCDRKSKKYHFQRLAFALALPKAFFNWGFIILFSHWLWIALSCLSVNTAVAFMGMIILACIAFTSATSPETLHFTLPSFPRRTTESEKSLA